MWRNYRLYFNKQCGRRVRPTRLAFNPDLWPFDLETGVRVASKVGNFLSKFGHARPSGSRIIRYLRDGRTDKNNADHVICFLIIIMPPTVGKRTISVAFVCPSVCPSVTYIANNSRTKRPSVPKFGLKVPHLRCDSHTSFKVRRSKVRVTDGRGIPCRPNPAATLLVIYAEI